MLACLVGWNLGKKYVKIKKLSILKLDPYLVKLFLKMSSTKTANFLVVFINLYLQNLSKFNKPKSP